MIDRPSFRNRDENNTRTHTKTWNIFSNCSRFATTDCAIETNQLEMKTKLDNSNWNAQHTFQSGPDFNHIIDKTKSIKMNLNGGNRRQKDVLVLSSTSNSTAVWQGICHRYEHQFILSITNNWVFFFHSALRHLTWSTRFLSVSYIDLLESFRVPVA